MACFSNGGNTRLTAIKQVVFGAIPTIADTDTQVHPFVSATPESVRATIDDPSLNGSREETEIRSGAESSTVDLEFTHRSNQYDDFLESALFGTWTNDVLEVGSQENPITIWLDQLDNGVVRQYTDLLVNTMTLNAPLEGNTTLSVSMIGTGQELAASGDATPTPQIPNRRPYVSFDGNITFAGATIGYIQDVTVNLSNALEAINVWGERDAACVGIGRSVVNLTVTAQFPDAQMLNAFDNETETSLSFTLTDPATGTSQLWEFTRVRVVQASVPITTSGQVIQTIQMRALRNTASGTSAIKITRT